MARKAAKTRPSAKSRASGLPRGQQHRPSANANITGRPQPGFNPHQQQGFAVGGFNDMGMSPAQTNPLQQLDAAVDPFDHAGDFDFSALLAQDLPMPIISDEEMAKLQQEIFGDAGDNFGGVEGDSQPQTLPPQQLPPVEYFTSSAMPQAPLEQLDLAAAAAFAFTGTGDFNNTNMPQFIFSDDPAVPEAPVDWIRYRFPSMPIGVYLPPIKAARSEEEEERGRSDPPSEPTVDGWIWSWSI
jgi:hypothetical protein